MTTGERALPSDRNTWYPGPAEFETSGVTKLVQALGVSGYDDLFTASIQDPLRYWQAVMRYCQIVWTESPRGLLDASVEREFPRWFPGGRLNWVNTVMQWGAREPLAGQAAIVAETEDGTVRSVSYAELLGQVRALAAALINIGVGPGDRVGLLMENGIEASVSLLAVAYIGAIVVPLFSGFGVEPIVSRLRAAEAGTLLATTGFNRRGKRIDMTQAVAEARARLPSLRRIVWKGPVEGSCAAMDHDWHDLAAAGAGRLCHAHIVTADDPFMIIYTSGTTGKPKGVVHTHGSFPIKIAHDAVVHFDVRPGDVFCWPANMGWIAGALVLSCALLRSATLVCYDGAPDFPDWSRMAQIVARHGVTHLGAAPTLIRGMASHEVAALRGDFSSVRLLITAGEVIGAEHFNWFRNCCGRGTRPLINYTGGTEVSGALLSSVLVRPIPPGGFNTISPGVDVDVVDSDGKPLRDAVGELVIRQPFLGMTRSFWHDDERYLETYWRTIPGLWVHGDLALRRADGSFLMMGRSDDTLKIAGKRVGPAEVEEVILELRQIAEAAAIGIEDPVKGQKLVLFVVPAPNVAATTAEIQELVTQHVGTRLGRAFRPGAVHAVRQLPKTRSGKIMRRVIRSVYCGLPAGDLSSLDNQDALGEICAPTLDA